MVFDPSVFTKNLEVLLDLWLYTSSRQTNEQPLYQGFLSNKPDSNGQRPHWHTGEEWVPRSNHERLERVMWIRKLNAAFPEMEACLRKIPALDTPHLTWVITFRPKNGRLAYLLTINSIRQSSGYISTTAQTKRRLVKIADQTKDCTSHGHLQEFIVNERSVFASSPEDARKIMAALMPKSPPPTSLSLRNSSETGLDSTEINPVP
jgi:hypothetical protein